MWIGSRICLTARQPYASPPGYQSPALGDNVPDPGSQDIIGAPLHHGSAPPTRYNNNDTLTNSAPYLSHSSAHQEDANASPASQATSHKINTDSSTPFASKGYIPQIYFDRIHMQCPNILIIQDYHFLNLLCRYTSRENLSAWYRDFQTIGRLAVQWIRTAQPQTLQLGPGTGWNWEGHQGLHLEYLERRLITNGDCGSESSHSVLEDSSILSDDEFSGSSKFMGDSGDKEKCMILHPVQSAYATRYPDFNPFEK